MRVGKLTAVRVPKHGLWKPINKIQALGNDLGPDKRVCLETVGVVVDEAGIKPFALFA